MVYDLDSSKECYAQLLDFSGLPVRINQIRGISFAGDRLYVLGTCVLFIFRVTDQSKGPVLKLERTVCMPEWVMGDNEQGNLHAVYASQEQNRVYLSFNAQCSIDIFDLEGKFLQRRYLWDIAPGFFPLPSGSTSKNFCFGIVRHIFANEHREIMLTTALMNGTKDSALISYNTGRMILSMKSQPLHGGVINNDRLYLCAIQKGEVQVFSWPPNQENPNTEIANIFYPRIVERKWQGSEQRVRGITIYHNSLICGVFYHGKPQPHQVPPRMLEFDLETGDQVREHWLPSYQGMEEPHIYGLLLAPKKLEQAVMLRKEFAFYKGGILIEPIRKIRHAPAVKSLNKSSNNDKKGCFENRQQNRVQTKEIVSTVETRNSSKNSLCHIIHQSHTSTLPDSVIDNLRSFPDLSNPAFNDQKKTFSDSKSQASANQSPSTVIFEDVGLCFERAARKFLSFNKKLRSKKSFWALQDVSFTVCEGETLGVIGRNGSGKSTLSMICSGVLIPDKGKVRINGRTQLLSLGVGFKNELSGRENVYISGSLLGLSKKEIKDKMCEIEEFAELGEFMDEPVRTYSSGMRSRLGFAIATAVKPDILILDEILATGDKAFQDKAMRRMREMRGLARSVIVVSHNPGQLRKLSTKVLWLEKGRMIMLGEPKEVLNAYDSFCQSPTKWLKNHLDIARKVGFGEIGA